MVISYRKGNPICRKIAFFLIKILRKEDFVKMPEITGDKLILPMVQIQGHYYLLGMTLCFLLLITKHQYGSKVNKNLTGNLYF